MGAMVRRICDIFSASSGFLDDIGILIVSRRCRIVDVGLLDLLMPLVSLMRLAGIWSVERASWSLMLRLGRRLSFS